MSRLFYTLLTISVNGGSRKINVLTNKHISVGLNINVRGRACSTRNYLEMLPVIHTSTYLVRNIHSKINYIARNSKVCAS